MKKALILAMLALLAVGTAPAWASDFSIFGSYLDTQDLNDTVGGGIKAGFPVGNPNWEIELRGTYLPDLTEDLSSFVNDKPKTSSDITAYPFDAGVKFNFAPESGVNPYLGGGASYYFLSADRGQIDDEAGAYAVGGVELLPREPRHGLLRRGDLPQHQRQDPTRAERLRPGRRRQLRGVPQP